ACRRWRRAAFRARVTHTGPYAIAPPATSEEAEESIGRQLGPPRAELLERVPKACLGRLLVERSVDVGNDQRLDRRGEALEPADLRLQGIGEWELDLVQESQRVVAHDDDELRLHDVELAREERPGFLVGFSGELDAVRPV